MEEKDFVLAFSLTAGLGPKSFQKLLKVFGTAEKAWGGSEKEFDDAGIGKANFAKFDKFRLSFDFQMYKSKLTKAKVEFVPFNDKFYPVSLKTINNPPIGLFIKGNKKLLDPGTEAGMTIGVVGARKITSYGRQVTENLVSELCTSDFVIVSGMALGVDGIAHESAVQNHGKTIAVLGCGVDCPFPRENEKLYEAIIDSGGLIISEYPLGMLPNKGTFPARNRIIAGLSSAVLITEAAEDSGSLITASNAALQGKRVFAVPGPITSHMSKGALKLLKQGAVLVSSVKDILDSLEVKSQPVRKAQGMNSKVKILSQKFKGLNKMEIKIIECLESEERTLDELSLLTKIPVSKLSIILSEMELEGKIISSRGTWKINY